ncbi:glyoxylate/hydroxypyruvate reductase A-like [Branchiostoma floridae]|uniref:Glyoxylate/hydroxypyruvate reductase A-like n=1 Tax=Branchiostoma floridae TaxID=7739 RepID=A0A9J7HF86_BRAFL|nr:glyoxylate/hydroxypyruvate reductase A-like [Branchiostoma floridae]
MASRLPVVHLYTCMAETVQELLHKLCPEMTVKVVGSNFDTLLPSDPTPEHVAALQEAEILLMDPNLMPPLMYQLPRLKWMQSTWAGVDAMFKHLDKTKPLPSYTLTRFGGVFGPAMAEYVISHIVNTERRAHKQWENQAKGLWERSGDIHNYRPLTMLSVGILGVGDIGKEIARCCKTFGMTVWGMVRRELSEDKRSPYVDHYRKFSELSELLQKCDYICNVLPSTAETKGLLNGNILKSCKEKKSVFINVGRGDVISEETIVNAIQSGWISHAILDVFETEPLPTSSLLWKMPQVTITPHVSAVSIPSQVTDMFYENYQRYLKGEELKYVVNLESGY